MGAPFTRILDPTSIRPDHSLVIRAATEEYSAIARFLGILGLESLTAQFDVSRSRRGGVALDGRLQAKLTQECVVSLVAIPQNVDEEVHRKFVLGGRPVARQDEFAVVDSVAEDPPELYTLAGIDVGAVVLEQLMLSLDSYPRAPGVELPDVAQGVSDMSDSPFAALKSLGHSDS